MCVSHAFVLQRMGIVSSTKREIEDKGRDLLLTSKLIDIRQTKRQLEMQQSMQLAATRERLLWIGGYYMTLGLLSGLRLLKLRRAGESITWDKRFLPFNQVTLLI